MSYLPGCMCRYVIPDGLYVIISGMNMGVIHPGRYVIPAKLYVILSEMNMGVIHPGKYVIPAGLGTITSGMSMGSYTPAGMAYSPQQVCYSCCGVYHTYCSVCHTGWAICHTFRDEWGAIHPGKYGIYLTVSMSYPTWCVCHTCRGVCHTCRNEYNDHTRGLSESLPRFFSIIRVQPRPVFKDDVLQYSILYHNVILSDLEVPVCILPHVIMFVQYI